MKTIQLASGGILKILGRPKAATSALRYMTYVLPQPTDGACSFFIRSRGKCSC